MYCFYLLDLVKPHFCCIHVRTGLAGPVSHGDVSMMNVTIITVKIKSLWKRKNYDNASRKCCKVSLFFFIFGFIGGKNMNSAHSSLSCTLTKPQTRTKGVFNSQFVSSPMHKKVKYKQNCIFGFKNDNLRMKRCDICRFANIIYRL